MNIRRRPPSTRRLGLQALGITGSNNGVGDNTTFYVETVASSQTVSAQERHSGPVAVLLCLTR